MGLFGFGNNDDDDAKDPKGVYIFGIPIVENAEARDATHAANADDRDSRRDARTDRIDTRQGGRTDRTDLRQGGRTDRTSLRCADGSCGAGETFGAVTAGLSGIASSLTSGLTSGLTGGLGSLIPIAVVGVVGVGGLYYITSRKK